MVLGFFFFFQAEDGIRDRTVTGVQTCALPISPRRCVSPGAARDLRRAARRGSRTTPRRARDSARASRSVDRRPRGTARSEERRVGKECRSRGAPDDYKKKMKEKEEAHERRHCV